MQIIHEPAFLDRIYLVESTSDVKTYTIHLVILCSCSHLFSGQPALIATSVVELVTILLCLHRTKYRHKLRQLYFANTMKLIVHLFLLGAYLLFIREVLPLAASANAKVLAKRRSSHIAIFMKFHHLSFGIRMLFPANLQIHNVTRNAERHENHEIIYSDETLAFCGNVCNRHVFKKW